MNNESKKPIDALYDEDNNDAIILFNEKGEKIESAPHPSMKFKMRVPYPVKAGDIVRSSDK